MKQTAVQINEATSIYHDTGVGRVGTSILRSPTTLRATGHEGHEGHEGHIMPLMPRRAPDRQRSPLRPNPV